jgi:competence protein ComFC
VRYYAQSGGVGFDDNALSTSHRIRGQAVAIVEVHPEPIDGPWVEGFVLDRHVVSSRPIGYLGEHMQFETTRSPLGELVYQLKYRSGKLDDIVDTAIGFVTERWGDVIDCVVPPPPSLHRTKQPAVLIAEGIAAHFGVSALPAAAIKATATQQMKNVPLQERGPLLSAAIQAGSDSVQSRRVLLVDDLWETGSTLRRVAEVMGQMGASEIRALAMTRTK